MLSNSSICSSQWVPKNCTECIPGQCGAGQSPPSADQWYCDWCTPGYSWPFQLPGHTAGNLPSTQSPRSILWCQGSGSQGKLTWGRAGRRKSYHVEGWYFFLKTSLEHSTPLLMYQRDRDGISRFFLFAALAVVHVWVFVPCSKTYGKLLAHMGLKRVSVRQFKLQNNQKTGFAFQAGEHGNHLTLSRLSSLCHFYIFCSDYIHFLCLPFCQDLSATQIPVKIVFHIHGISHCEHIWSEHFWCSHPFSLW